MPETLFLKVLVQQARTEIATKGRRRPRNLRSRGPRPWPSNNNKKRSRSHIRLSFKDLIRRNILWYSYLRIKEAHQTWQSIRHQIKELPKASSCKSPRTWRLQTSTRSPGSMSWTKASQPVVRSPPRTTKWSPSNCEEWANAIKLRTVIHWRRPSWLPRCRHNARALSMDFWHLQFRAIRNQQAIRKPRPW